MRNNKVEFLTRPHQFIMKKFLIKIWRWFFPFEPSEEYVEKWYADGNGIFDNMSDEEKEKFLTPDKDLPLGL